MAQSEKQPQSFSQTEVIESNHENPKTIEKEEDYRKHRRTLVLRSRPNPSALTQVGETSLVNYNQTPQAQTTPDSSSREMENSVPRRHSSLIWSANTINNEFMNKKKSKCCCIYEKPRQYDESSSESDSSSTDRFNSSDEDAKSRKKSSQSNTSTCATNSCRGHKSTCYRKVILKAREPDKVVLPPEPDPPETKD